MLIVEPRVVSIFWAHSPISVKICVCLVSILGAISNCEPLKYRCPTKKCNWNNLNPFLLVDRIFLPNILPWNSLHEFISLPREWVCRIDCDIIVYFDQWNSGWVQMFAQRRKLVSCDPSTQEIIFCGILCSKCATWEYTKAPSTGIHMAPTWYYLSSHNTIPTRDQFSGLLLITNKFG